MRGLKAMSKVFLGEVARERRETFNGSKRGYPVVGLEHLFPEDIILSAWDEDKDNSFSKLFREGDVLFGRRRAYLKKAAVAPFDGICSGDITVIEAIPGKIRPELLPFVIQNDAFFEFAINKSAGSLSPRVKWERLKDYEFELPDMERQRELAKVLWAIDATKRSYRKLLEKTDDLLKSQFIEMFGDPITNSMGWKTKTLSDVAPEVQHDGDFGETVWLLNLDAVESNTGKVVEKLRIPIEAVGNSTCRFGDEHILYSRLRPYLNKVVVPDEEGYATTEMIPLKPNPASLNRDFLAQLLRSDEFVEHATNLSTGTRMPRVPMAELRNFKCILPPIKMQNQYVVIIEQVAKSKLELEHSLMELTAVYKKLLSENLG
jgi:type I restriction enzyme S subunit